MHLRAKRDITASVKHKYTDTASKSSLHAGQTLRLLQYFHSMAHSPLKTGTDRKRSR